MLSHVNIGANDLPRMIAFYDAVLGCLGIGRSHRDDDSVYAGWRAAAGGPVLYVGRPFDGAPATAGNGGMLAFLAPDQRAVDAAYRMALELGGSSEGAPGPRPQYRPGYYGAYFRDPEGNKLHVVHMAA
ncbi:MAG: VOC family protein [Janthinobacterium lividum]